MDTYKRTVTDTPIDRCSHEHCDPLYAYGYPRPTVSYADGYSYTYKDLNTYTDTYFDRASNNAFTDVDGNSVEYHPK